MIQRTDITDSAIKEAYAAFNTIGKMASHFKIPHITIFRRCKNLGLTFKNGGAREAIPLNEILDGLHPQYGTFKLKQRLLKEGLLSNICSECDCVTWNDKPLNMQLDHKNGDSSDHRFDNLRMLCPNCHSQTDTYCGKNK